MTLTQKPRMCIAPELRIATPCAWLRYIVADYVQTNLRRTKLGQRRPSPADLDMRSDAEIALQGLVTQVMLVAARFAATMGPGIPMGCGGRLS